MKQLLLSIAIFASFSVKAQTGKIGKDTTLCYALTTDERDGQGYSGKGSVPFRFRCLNVSENGQHIKFIDEKTKQDLPFYYLVWMSVDITRLDTTKKISLQP